MPVSRTFTYDNFRGGEWGLLAGEKPPANSFHGLNVMVYSNGLIGPRPGLKDFTPASMPVGVLRAFVETPTPDREGLFIIGNRAYYSSFRNFALPPVLYTGDVLSAGSAPLHPKIDTTSFLVAVPKSTAIATDGGVWRIKPVTGVMTELKNPDLTSLPAGVDLELYDSQLLIVQDGDMPRILGSAPSADRLTYDFTDGDFLDVGDNWGIASILVQGNYLAILKRNSVHVMSGVFATDSMVVRQVSRAETTHKPWHTIVDNNERIWFIPLFREDLATFSGAQVTTLGQFKNLSPRNGETGALPMKRGITAFNGQLSNASILAVQLGDSAPSRGILNHNSVTTFHEFDKPVTGMVGSLGSHVILTDGGAVATAAKLYGVNFEYDRPGFTSDNNNSPGDGSTTPFDAELTLPVWFDRSGNAVRVRYVTVEVLKYDTGIANNTLDVTVMTLDRPNGAGDYINDTKDWTEDSGDATEEGAHDRLVFPQHTAIGHGFQVKLSNIVGVAIRSVTVGFEDFVEQPRIK